MAASTGASAATAASSAPAGPTAADQGPSPLAAGAGAPGVWPSPGVPGDLFAPAREAPAAAAEPDGHVVDVAAALFLERGIAGVRMTDVADAAGVGVATLYRHFGDKRGLVVEAGTLLWERLDAHIASIVESHEFLALDGLSRFCRLMAEYGEVFAAHRDFVRFLAEFDHAMALSPASREGLAGYGRAVDSFYVMFEDTYLLGRQDGSIARELDFPVFYRSVTHALMGLAEKLVLGEVIPSDDFSGASAELGCMVDVVCRAIAADGDSPLDAVAGAGNRGGLAATPGRGER